MSGPKRQPRLVEGSSHIDESDDSSIDEDEAFNSEDEDLYGNFFVNKKKNGEDSAGEESNDSDSEKDWAGSTDGESDEENDGGAYMLNLLDNLDKQVPDAGKRGDKESSMFQSTTSSSLSAGKEPKLTLDSLMGGIADTAGFASVQKSLRTLSGGADKDGKRKLETAQVPVSRVVSERASRKVNYQATSEDVTGWREAVYEQRNAETLDFRTNKGGTSCNRVTRDTLVEKFEASTDFEKELQQALTQAGMQDEKALKKRERARLIKEGQLNEDDWSEPEDPSDDLGANRISIEEYKKRHGELAKIRALMFDEEQKNHRINKIKSKKYRKIRKRQQERAKDAENEAALMQDPSLEMQRIEHEEMNRMKERMSLQHRNTSKWARRILRRGAKMDVEERKALSLQIAKGEELRRKVMGEGYDGNESSESETEEDLIRKAADILKDDEDEDAQGTSKKGLFQLEFMKRGLQKQRTRAKEEARQLLEELEANAAENLSSDSEDDEGGSEIATMPSKTKVASAAEVEKVLPDGKLVASTLQFGNAERFTVSSNADLGGEGKSEVTCRATTEKRQTQDKDGGHETKGAKKKRQRTRNKDTSEETRPELDEENPWIAANPSRSKKARAKSAAVVVNVHDAASMLVGDKTTETASTHNVPPAPSTATADEKSVQEVNTKKRVAEQSQEELVKQAFSAPVDLEAEEEFEKEKARMKERDDPTRKQKEDTFVSGWGSWAGAGAPPPNKKPRKLPPKLQPPARKPQGAPKRKDDGKKYVIINEKRLKKTAKFQLSEIPYPYRSRAEYERAISGNIGQEWNTINGTKEMTRPAVLVRAGKIIQPITKKSKQQRRGPAKF